MHLGEVDDALGQRAEGAAGVEGGGEAAARLQLGPETENQSHHRFDWLFSQLFPSVSHSHDFRGRLTKESGIAVAERHLSFETDPPL